MSHKKFGPDRFSRFHVYWIQTNKQTDRQVKFIYRCNSIKNDNFGIYEVEKFIRFIFLDLGMGPDYVVLLNPETKEYYMWMILKI